MTAPRSICIVGLEDYPLLAGKENGEFSGGGESVQHMLLARAWRDLGVAVTVIVRNHGQPSDIVVDGIRLLSAFRERAGIPGLRFFHPRATGLLAALRKADAQVYYQSPASVHTGITAWFCRLHDKKFVLRIASDANCIPGRQLIRFWRDRKIYEYGLRHADLIAAQTVMQQKLLERHYGLASTVVPMTVESSSAETPQVRDIDVLWVGNLREVKRPEIALEMARCLPHVRFTIVGGPLPGRREYYEQIARAARDIPNLTFVGGVPYEDTGRFFDRARVLLNTSSVEGFPNTFLQAWIRGVPVVSFFDPDGLIVRHRLGHRLDSVEQGVALLETWFSPSGPQACDDLQACGEAVREFAASRYTPSRVAGSYLDLLGEEPPLRVIQIGPALDVRGGVSAVERLIVDKVGGYISLHQLSTMEESSWRRRLQVFLKAARELRRQLRRPGRVVVHVHFASRGSTLRKLLLARIVLRASRPLIFHAHGASFDRFFESLPRFLQGLICRTLRQADQFLVLSTQWRRFYVERCGLDERRVTILPNPVQLPTAVPERTDRSRVQILFLGRIGRRKGAFNLLQAFLSLPAATLARAHLVVAGDGETELLRQKAGAETTVTVLSWVDANERNALLAASDVFALPSYEEGMPMAILEAMAYGLPVVTTPVGGIPDVIIHGQEGLLVEPGSIPQLTQALQALIEDAPLRAAMGERARKRAEEFDADRYAMRLMAIYQRCGSSVATPPWRTLTATWGKSRLVASKWQE